MFDDIRKHKKALEDNRKLYKELKRLKDHDEFKTYMGLLRRAASAKMINAFTGDSIKDWNQFCKVRGEIQAHLYPIQETTNSDSMVEHLDKQLKELYEQVD